MTRLLFAVLAVSAAVAVSFVITTHPANAQDLFGDEGPVSVKLAERVTVKKQDVKAKLQAEYAALSKARSELMTEEEFREAIAESKKTNNRLAARRELERAAKIFGEIAEKHPQTPEGRAAMRSKRALMIIERPAGGIQDFDDAFEDSDDEFGGNDRPLSVVTSRTPYGFDRATHSWVQGILNTNGGGWNITYDLAGNKDKYKGFLHVVPNRKLGTLRPGEVVRLTGRLDPSARDDRGYPMYRITTVQRISLQSRSTD